MLSDAIDEEDENGENEIINKKSRLVKNNHSLQVSLTDVTNTGADW